MPPKKWSSQGGKGAGAPAGRRLDPYDGKACTFEELTQKYRGQYSNAQMKEYWESEMTPVADERRSTGYASADAPTPAETPESESKAEASVSSASGVPSVTFCPDPKTIGAKFTATFDKDPKGNFASVNPGDQGFRVGGQTLNGQFAKDLYDLAWQETDKYGTFHNKLFASAEVGKLTAAPASLLSTNPNLEASFVRKASEAKVSTVFVDVFKASLCVHEVSKNMAMVYTVGPRRQDCASDPDFLTQVEATAENIARACTEYNVAATENNVARIEIVRVPLVSGGAFAGRCPKDAVAAALLRGLMNGSGPDLPEFNFSFDGDIFRQAWGKMSQAQ